MNRMKITNDFDFDSLEEGYVIYVFTIKLPLKNMTRKRILFFVVKNI